MVIFRSILFITVFLGALPTPQNVRLSVEFKEPVVEGLPINAELNIQHRKENEVDYKSAQMDGRPVSLEFVKEEKLQDLVKTTFSFKIKEKSGGLHVLPPIIVVVGGDKFESPRMTYQVKGRNQAEKAEKPSSESVSTSPLIFKLEPFVEGKKVLYPKQRVVVGYRYLFNDNVELTEEILPLLEPQGFKKVGEEKIENFRRNDIGVHEIRQKVEAVTPGKYSIGPSTIKGFPYQLNLLQTKEYAQNLVQASAPVVELEIKPFPEKGRPPSFNGAIGKDLTFKVVLQSFYDVNVGDKITLSLEIAGDGEIENAPMPDLCCQPGFPGRFRQSDIPPAEIFKHGIKFVVIDLTPLSTAVKEIPSIEFSYFNPEDETYKSIKSEPIPIKVMPTAEGLLEVKEGIDPFLSTSKSNTETDWPELNAKPQEIDIATIYPLTPEDLQARFLGTPTSLWILPFGIGLLLFQIDLKKRLLKRKGLKQTKKETFDLWNEVELMQNNSPELPNKISNALLLQLKEAGLIDNASISYSELPDTGITGVVRQFLALIETERFSKIKRMGPQEMKDEGKRLFEKIKKSVKQ